MIIGVTGHIASGKDTLCEILEKKGYKHISLSNILRDMLAKQGKPSTRENLTALGNDLRNTKGDNILAKLALEKIDKSKWLISSIGRVAEVKELQKNKDFKLIFVTATAENRYDRLVSRNREGDVLSFNDFLSQEKKESQGGGGMFREFDNIKEIANIVISNDGSLEEFNKKVQHLLLSLSS